MYETRFLNIDEKGIYNIDLLESIKYTDPGAVEIKLKTCEAFYFEDASKYLFSSLCAFLEPQSLDNYVFSNCFDVLQYSQKSCKIRKEIDDNIKQAEELA